MKDVEFTQQIACFVASLSTEINKLLRSDDVTRKFVVIELVGETAHGVSRIEQERAHVRVSVDIERLK